MRGISLVAGDKSRIRSPVFSCVVIRKKMVGKIPLFADVLGDAWPILLSEGYRGHFFSLGLHDLNSAVRESK